MAWYQCHTGLKTYATIGFPEGLGEDYTDVFWSVAGAISAIGIIGGLTRFALPHETSDETRRPEEIKPDEVHA